jgi:hypothetical protein
VFGINRLTGVMAPYVFEGHANALVVAFYFKYRLLPQLVKGDLVVIDGASYWGGGDHEGVRRLLRPLFQQAGVDAIYLPPRAPWCAATPPSPVPALAPVPPSHRHSCAHLRGPGGTQSRRRTSG